MLKLFYWILLDPRLKSYGLEHGKFLNDNYIEDVLIQFKEKYTPDEVLKYSIVVYFDVFDQEIDYVEEEYPKMILHLTTM